MTDVPRMTDADMLRSLRSVMNCMTDRGQVEIGTPQSREIIDVIDELRKRTTHSLEAVSLTVQPNEMPKP